MVRKLKDDEQYFYYHIEGNIHCEKKDCYLEVYVDKNNFLHNENGKPALIDSDGDISYFYYFHGYRHNVNGTAKEIYTKNGKKYEPKIIDERLFGIYYALYGKRLTKEEWDLERNRLLMLDEL